MPRGWDADDAARATSGYGYLTGSRLPSLNDQQFYDPKDAEYYQDRDSVSSTVNIGDDDMDMSYTDIGNLGPAPLSMLPTPSTNANRPRTVAAGYQPYVGSRSPNSPPEVYQKGKLTVMFRDGTVYNFYGVTGEEWLKFKGQGSIGPMLNRLPVPGFLLAKDHGPADMSNVSPKVASTIYRVARAAQVQFASTRLRYVPVSGGGAGAPVTKVVPVKNSVPKDVGAKMRRASKQASQNPARNKGKNPYR
jgi:hypothetical protein